MYRLPIGLEQVNRELTISWIEVPKITYSEPFLFQTIQRAMSNGVSVSVSSLSEFLAWSKDCASTEPLGAILHLSRCGSTLAGRILAQRSRTVVLSEPKPINETLIAIRNGLNQEIGFQLLRRFVSLYAQATEMSGQTILKLTSWNIHFGRHLHSAWPRARWAILHRDPIDVLFSLLRRPPAWSPQEANDQNYLVRATELAKNLEMQIRMAEAFFDHEHAVAIAYESLPDAVWTSLCSDWELATTAADISAMEEAARYDSFSPSREFTRHRLDLGEIDRRAKVDEIGERICGEAYRRFLAKVAADRHQLSHQHSDTSVSRE